MHSNDFLLAEYGFIFPENAWDQVFLDQFVVPLFSEDQKETLETAGFLGKYVLDRDGVCYRTQIALRLLCLSTNKWKRVVEGLDDEEKDQIRVDHRLVKILDQFKSHASEMLARVSKIDSKLAGQETLSKRWEQISKLMQATIDKIQK